ncbi:MAG: hypothetical protein H6559_25545 [Lewinellaceae bacterium]|nr:hypothetical protein [Lewinellaceae bacterium]
MGKKTPGNEKERAGQPLSEKERRIHEQGLVGILRQLHDELDAAVAAGPPAWRRAKSWSAWCSSTPGGRRRKRRGWPAGCGRNTKHRKKLK